ncbi:MAG: hypothetical protein M3Q46_12460, partial [Verrucomicrobiota bacterium]|nr:hypothetical protein [Verrucomicrobiota bacterium]
RSETRGPDGRGDEIERAIAQPDAAKSKERKPEDVPSIADPHETIGEANCHGYGQNPDHRFPLPHPRERRAAESRRTGVIDEKEKNHAGGTSGCQCPLDSKTAPTKVENKRDAKSSENVPNNLIEIERIASKEVAQQSHQHLVTGGEVHRRECCGIHVDTRLPGEDGFRKMCELDERSMEIHDIVLVRPQDEEDSNSTPNTEDQKKEIRAMKFVILPWHSPQEAPSGPCPGERDSKEENDNCPSGQTGDEDYLISQGPQRG